MNNIGEILAANQDFTITFVGDSITWGENHCTPNETYVACFASMLAREFPNASVYRYDGIAGGAKDPLTGYDRYTVQSGKCGRLHVLRSGVGGNTVARAAARFADYTGTLASGTRSNVIFTMFGINDALYTDPDRYAEPSLFYENYCALLHRISESEPNADLIVMSATTNDQTIDAHVQKTYELAQDLSLPLIDLYRLWSDHYRQDAPNFGHGDWLAGGRDACHPTPKAAQIMAEAILSEWKKTWF